MKQLYFLFFCAILPATAYAIVNINTANYQELVSVNGIGPKKAQAIIEYRNIHGKLKNFDELTKVKGFNQKSITKLQTKIEIK